MAHALKRTCTRKLRRIVCYLKRWRLVINEEAMSENKHEIQKIHDSCLEKNLYA